MKPGDMVLYESHSLIHGRPFPLKGKYFANIFIHFEPTGHSKRHQAEQLGDLDMKKQYRKATENRAGSDLNSRSGKLPPYILENSPEVKNWMRSHSNGWEAPSPVDPGKAEAHTAAGTGDLDTLRKLAKQKPHVLHLKDANGWQPIHEASRGGHKNVVELLVEHGQDINERTNHGSGGSPLYLATQAHSDDHPLVRYFISIGALNIGPDL
uniref:Uncharacterized protein n=1 Tax=Attheya septentrionalis TaxID=420275 RepID=A0A7S2UHM2_9STRA